MKKGLFLLLAIFTLGTFKVSADVAAPIVNYKSIKVELYGGADVDKLKEDIEKLDDVKSVTIIEGEENNTCEPEKCSTSETLSEKDIKSLKNATLIIDISLGILIGLMIIVIVLMISKRKKDSKKDA